MAQTVKKINSKHVEQAVQSPTDNLINGRGCFTPAPSDEWEAALQQLIVAREAASLTGAKALASYNIPVVIHIIHGGQALGTYPNISNAQAVSQINVLNNDFAGTGLNATTYPSTAFTAYATAAGLPTANKDALGRPKISNFNISFCLATINKSGGAMSEIGIDRVNFNTFTLTSGYTSKDPANAAYSTPATFQSFIDNIVKPQTIWDPTKYMNIWTTDENISTGLLGFATFPVGVTLAGITGSGTATNDGLWCWTKAFGNTGTLDPSYNKGRTATHEIGHWLGMRHIWGDGSCATDYCLDTPPAAGPNYSSTGYPFHANSCTSPTGVSNTTPNGANGEMFMNFMDYTPDATMYMFTEDQRTRAQTVMANGTYRKFLGTHGLCSVASATPATAAFTMTNSACTGAVVLPTNSSTGSPVPTYTWSASPTTGVSFSPSSTSANPSITFATNGTYVITLAAQSGTTAISTKTVGITISTCATPCSGTLTNFRNVDTLTMYRTGTGAGCTINGYVGGNNCYGDKEKAEYYSSTGLVGTSKVNGAIVLFFRSGTIGTKGTSNIVFKMYSGNNTTGPSGAALASYTAPLSSIIATTPTTGVSYCGNPGLAFSTPIILPYSFNFASPVNITSDFILSVTVPTATGDTIAIMQNSGSGHTFSTAWEMQSSGTWFKFNDGTSNTWQQNASLAILPKIACLSVGITDVNGISGNFAVFPNPSEGIFNFAVSMPQARDLQFNVLNSIGQSVFTKTEKSITNSVIPLDLSHLAKGIYFVNIIDSTGDKVIKKIIIQ